MSYWPPNVGFFDCPVQERVPEDSSYSGEVYTWADHSASPEVSHMIDLTIG